MNFLAPGAFGLGLLLPVIIALYLLKLRRIEHPVASNYLWKRMVRDVEANAPWQKLRSNLLLILQLLFLAVLIFALTRPFTWGEGVGGNAAILILDTSASMSAVDVSPNRIGSAKQRARQLVDDLPDNARVTIIEAGQETKVLLSSSLDRRQAFLTIEKLTAGTSGSDLGVALELASAIAARQPGTEIIVLSDGRVMLPDRLILKGRLRYIPFGLSTENQAVSLLKLETHANSKTQTAFIQVTNYGKKPASRRLSVFADDLLINVYDLTDIPPGGQKSIIVEDIPPGTIKIDAQLNEPDAFLLDDHAVTVKSNSAPVAVTLVTQGNLFLKTALSLLPGIQLTEQLVDIRPEENAIGDAIDDPSPTPDLPGGDGTLTPMLTIFDGYIPGNDIPSGNLLFIAPPTSTDFFSITGSVNDPKVRAIDASDPLLANVSLAETNVLDAVNIQLPAWATPVIAGDLEAGFVPLLFRGETGGRRVAVLAFDLRRSDLPLQVAFPLLLSNMVSWLSPTSGNTIPSQVLPGESLVFNVQQASETITIIKPDQSTIQLQPVNNRYVFTDTTQLGVYEIQGISLGQPTGSGGSTRFTVNLFSPQESDIKPAENLPGVSFEGETSTTLSNQAIHEWWRLIAFLAFGILVGEWVVYQRAGLTRLYDLLGRIRPNRNRLPYKGNR